MTETEKSHSIRINKKNLEKLIKLKIIPRESYDSVITRILQKRNRLKKEE